MAKFYYDIEQGTVSWFKLRSGIPTAGSFAKIITPVNGDLSKSWRKYAAQLIWERVMNTTTMDLVTSHYMEEGKRLEPIAVKQFEFVNGVETKKVGFVTTDDGTVGASPDRLLVGRQATLETKCPSGPIHMLYALFGPDVATDSKYKPQIQGQLWVCEADEGFFYSYIEAGPAYQTETHRDEPYIAKMADAIAEFNEKLAEYTAVARSLGVFQAYDEMATPADVELGEQSREEPLMNPAPHYLADDGADRELTRRIMGPDWEF